MIGLDFGGYNAEKINFCNNKNINGFQNIDNKSDFRLQLINETAH